MERGENLWIATPQNYRIPSSGLHCLISDVITVSPSL